MKEDKEKNKSSLKIIIFISIILIIILIVLDIKTSGENSWDSFGYACMGIIDALVLWLIWIIYLIKLAIIKRKNNSKYFWIPLVISIFILILPIILFFIVLSVKISII